MVVTPQFCVGALSISIGAEAARARGDAGASFPSAPDMRQRLSPTICITHVWPCLVRGHGSFRALTSSISSQRYVHAQVIADWFVLLWWLLSSGNAPAQGKGDRYQEIWISPSSCGRGGAALLGAAVCSGSFNLSSGCNLLWFTQGEQRLL